MKNKGFTLIEVLGVILVLGIIGAMIYPKVTDTINKSRMNSYNVSAKRLVDFMNSYALDKKATLTPFEGCSYDFDLNITDCDDIVFSGSLPTGGSIEVDSSGNVNGSISFEQYNVEIVNGIVTEVDSGIKKGTEYAFDYTGNYQVFVVPKTGYYNIQLWGASGGISTGGFPTDTPGKGAYTEGVLNLLKDEKIYVYVGEQGTNGAGTISSTYNGGGGDTTTNASNCPGSGTSGGGATDIRLISGSWDNSLSLVSRIMVAAGAGGSGGFGLGSDGGTLTSFTGTYSSSGNPHGHSNQSAASQISAGISDNKSASNTSGTPNSDGLFGIGGQGAGAGCSGAGGGGGYYGGAGAYNMGAGSGGSSYISGHTGCVAITSSTDITAKSGCTTGTTDNSCSIHYSLKKFTDTVMKAGNESMPTHDGESTMIGNTGNGYAKITYVGDN